MPVARRFRRPPRVRTQGLTLIELMVTLAVVAIVAGLGVPSFLQMLARHAITTQAEELQDAVRIGRAEAMKRSGPVVLCRTEPDKPGRCAVGGGNWQTWLLFTDAGRTGAFAAGDAVLRQHVDVSSHLAVEGNAAIIRFESTGIAHADVDSPVFRFSPAGTATGASGGARAPQRVMCVNPRGAIGGGASCP